VEKGTRVRVTGGRKHKDKVGTIFWEGPDKYRDDGKRFGLHVDDGETIWIRSDYCEALDASDPAFAIAEPDGPIPEKGTRVRWTDDEGEHSGEVFWTGESKNGPGTRLGIRRDETEEAVWRDARLVEVVVDDDPEVPF
jgi:hypothetical protein